VTALLPAPDPLLLPGGTTTAAGPVRTVSSSALSGPVLLGLLAVCVLAVAGGGLVVARRRSHPLA
jgi:hypothetical protein